MADELVLMQRLNKLREHVQLLKVIRAEPKERFISNSLVYRNAERSLQLAIQATLDIGNHILAQKKLKEPDEYRDVIKILGENGILTNDLATKLMPLAGLRNILVHEYTDVDRTRIYEAIQTGLEDFEEFSKQIGKQL